MYINIHIKLYQYLQVHHLHSSDDRGIVQPVPDVVDPGEDREDEAEHDHNQPAWFGQPVAVWGSQVPDPVNRGFKKEFSEMKTFGEKIQYSIFIFYFCFGTSYAHVKNNKSKISYLNIVKSLRSPNRKPWSSEDSE